MSGGVSSWLRLSRAAPSQVSGPRLAKRHHRLVAQRLEQGEFLFVECDVRRAGLVGVDQAERRALDLQRQQQEGGRVDLAAVPGWQLVRDGGHGRVADQGIHALVAHHAEEVLRVLERHAKQPGDGRGVFAQAEAAGEALRGGVAQAEQHAAKTQGAVHGLQHHAQHVVEFEVFHHRIGDVLDAGGQQLGRDAARHRRGLGAGGRRCVGGCLGRELQGLQGVLWHRLQGRGPQQPGRGRTGCDLHTQGLGGLGQFLACGQGHGLDVSALQPQAAGITGGQAGQFPRQRIALLVQEGVGHFVGRQAQPAQAFVGVRGHARGRVAHGLAHEPLDAGGQVPHARHAQAQVLAGHAKHAQGCDILGLAGGDRLAHLLGLFGKVELGEQAAQVLEQRTDEHLFAFARDGAQVAGERAGQQRAQELGLEQVGVRLVLHVLEQHQAHGDVADADKADQADRPRDRADAAAAGVRELRRVDQAQQLVGQRHVLQDLAGQRVQAFVFRRGHALHMADGFGHGREIALVAHAPQQETQRGVAALRRRGAGVLQLLLALPVAQRLREGLRAADALSRVAREAAHEQAAQRVVHLVHAVLRQFEVFARDALDRAPGVAAIDQGFAEQHLGEHQRGAEHVACGCGALSRGSLGREVARRALNGVRVTVGRGHARGDAEVGELGAQASVEQDVRGLEIAVHHPDRVCHLQRLEHGDHQVHRVRGAQGAVVLQPMYSALI
eukprot:Opistho-1_new@37394